MDDETGRNPLTGAPSTEFGPKTSEIGTPLAAEGGGRLASEAGLPYTPQEYSPPYSSQSDYTGGTENYTGGRESYNSGPTGGGSSRKNLDPQAPKHSVLTRCCAGILLTGLGFVSLRACESQPAGSILWHAEHMALNIIAPGSPANHATGSFAHHAAKPDNSLTGKISRALSSAFADAFLSHPAGPPNPKPTESINHEKVTSHIKHTLGKRATATAIESPGSEP